MLLKPETGGADLYKQLFIYLEQLEYPDNNNNNNLKNEKPQKILIQDFFLSL